MRGPSNWITFGSLDNMDVGIPMRFFFKHNTMGSSVFFGFSNLREESLRIYISSMHYIEGLF